MPLAKFESMLKRTMGLDIQSIGRPMLERALQERQGSCGVADLDAYWLLLQMSEPEQLQLIESVIVPETWFFRNREAFQEMAQLQQRMADQGQPPSRMILVSVTAGKWDPPNVPEHTILIHGEKDDVVLLPDVLDWARPQDIPVIVIPGGDHLFNSKLHHLRNIVTGMLRL